MTHGAGAQSVIRGLLQLMEIMLLIYSFIHSFIHSFIRACVRSEVHLSPKSNVFHISK